MELQRELRQPERGQQGVVAYRPELQDKQYSLRFGECVHVDPHGGRAALSTCLSP